MRISEALGAAELSFSFNSASFSAKVEKLIKVFEKYRKRRNVEFVINLTHFFDITKLS